MNRTDILQVNPEGTLTWRAKTFRCAIGKAGVSTDKSEGDGTTPVGVFPIRKLYYRADRIPKPDCELPTEVLNQRDGWCDDPKHQDYNLKVNLPHKASCEKLWRNDHIYDLIVIVGHNDDPPVQGRGSAIFIHIARPEYEVTEGCVALNQDDLLEILKELTTKCSLQIRS